MEYSYFDRDLSWLRFNHRVLQEAKDKRNPLYERIKFIAIYSSNLDEFFKVRVSDIRQIKDLKKKLRKKLITRPNKLLKEIKKQVDLQGDELGRILREEIVPGLKENGIFLLTMKELETSGQTIWSQEALEKFDKCEANKLESPLEIENELLYLIGKKSDSELLFYPIPGGSDRFVLLDENKIAYADDLLKIKLKEKYGIPFFSIKVSRDAELYIEDEYSGNLLDKIISSLPNRASGQVTRTLVERDIDTEVLKLFSQILDINETDIVHGGIHHNLSDFFGFPNPSQTDLSLPDLPPQRSIALRNAKSMFEAIQEKDRLLSFPYQSFEDVVRLVEEAAEDKSVHNISMTLYRVSKDSSIAKALMKAVENGKEVYAFIETKARFDEENNIKWGKKLQEAGATIMYSYPGIKVHSKILFIERTNADRSESYAYIGSGNFNEKTSKVYTDFALMTSNKKICSDLKQVFEVLQGRLIIPKPKRLLVSPFNTRKVLTEAIDREIANAGEGKASSISLKMNSLQDKKLINKLYDASRAGVQIKIIVRGICCLVPGIAEQSENIEVRSIVGRFLEHSRLYLFHNDGKEKMYMGSADWMTRNLDHRIEVLSPILDEDIFTHLKSFFENQWQDKAKARLIDDLQSNLYIDPQSDLKSSQELAYEDYASLD
ncbi:MAG: polyphosphate kinase 1 [Bacteroidota bacterium]